MWDDRRREIAFLAEGIAEENITNGIVSLNKILKKKDIEVIYGNYGKYFEGDLVHEDGNFWIYINQDILTEKKSPRTRFTLAHELGHYFIDEHRNLLLQGISLSFRGNSFHSEKHTEKEANLFSSNLLMPFSRFKRKASRFEPGISSIIGLSKFYKTSIEATAIRYIDLDICPSIFIRWREDFTSHYASYSRSFSGLSGVKGRPVIRVVDNYISEIFDSLESVEINEEFYEVATNLSRWIATIKPESRYDLTGLEQTIRLGNYGGMTLLLFQ
ncbi:MAG: ImmA/IrrE family metallo-endopeptidase [Bacteroidetes bacterium]|nr:ImmA/IrrE family metallo-endopeptidase [Bacteroidota bacterium]